MTKVIKGSEGYVFNTNLDTARKRLPERLKGISDEKLRELVELAYAVVDLVLDETESNQEEDG